MSPRVAVTGANGFIGQTVVRHFRDAGWDVRAIIRSGRQCALPDGVALVPVRFTASELARAAQGSDVVVHTAGLTRAATGGQFQGVNVEITREVMRAAAVAGARLVHISSQAAAGPGTPERPRREDDPPSPLTAEGQVFALGHPESVTAKGLSDALARVLGRPFRRVRIPYAFLLVAAVAGD